MSAGTLPAILLTLRVAATATLLVGIPGTLLAYLLARRDFPGKALVSAVVLLPLVLPPTAVGFLLLQLLAVDGPLGSRTLGFDLGILLTWKAAVLAAAVVALPLVVRTARVTFEGVDPELERLARTLGHGRMATFWGFTVPMASRGLAAALLLGFTRAIGEFGATIILAGNIPFRTRTLATAIFSAQQVGDDRQAMGLAGLALALGLVAILVSEHLVSGRRVRKRERAPDRAPDGVEGGASR
jgi:molybdate transport system permease protein